LKVGGMQGQLNGKGKDKWGRGGGQERIGRKREYEKGMYVIAREKAEKWPLARNKKGQGNEEGIVE
jgi:hypothetical protein